MKKAIKYCRVSTEEQGDRYSLPAQSDYIDAYAEKQGYTIAAYYTDTKSGKNFNRPGWKNLIQDVESGKAKADVVICLNTYRFSRDFVDSLLMQKELDSLGLSLEFVEGKVFDFFNPDKEDAGELMLDVIERAGADAERRRISKRTKRGMTKRSAQGLWVCGHPPRGYSWSDKMIVPNEDAPIILKAFEMFAEGVNSTEEVRKMIRRKGIKISRNQMIRILQNPVYAGKIRYKDRGEEHIVQGQHEAIVNSELFSACQDVFKGRRRKQKKRNVLAPDFPLRGFLLCKDCQGTLTAAHSKSGTGKKYGYYYCQRGCKVSFRSDMLNNQFVGMLNDMQLSPALTEVYSEIIKHDHAATFDRRKAEERAEKLNLKKAEGRLEGLADKFVDGDIEKEVYNRLKNKYQAQRDQARIKIDQIEKMQGDFPLYLDYALDFLTRIGVVYGDAGVDIKQKIISSISPSGFVYQDGTYRTLKNDSFFSLIGLKISTLEEEKKGQEAEVRRLNPLRVANGLISNSYLTTLERIYALKYYVG